ncbi:MAG: nucleoside hydrolase, partial [Armatimonadota bacterium]
ILDMDVGVDDALALVWALRSPALDVEAVTTVSGNTSARQAFLNSHFVIETAGGQIPRVVAEGVERPGGTAAEHVHGPDGLGGLSRFTNADGSPRYPSPNISSSTERASEVICRLLREKGGDATLVTTGPLSNLAEALEKDPDILSMAKGVVCMAGAFFVPGNVTPVAEFNVFADPQAARRVLYSGAKLTFVGLDVTHKVVLLREQLEEWIGPKPSRLGQFLLDCTEFCMEFHMRTEGFFGIYMHDPLAVVYAAEPSLLRTETFYVDVETSGEITRGMTVVDRRLSNVPKQGVPVQVAVDVDVERFVSIFRTVVFGK